MLLSLLTIALLDLGAPRMAEAPVLPTGCDIVQGQRCCTLDNGVRCCGFSSRANGPIMGCACGENSS